ncbi:hypothetical protein H2200_002664 [Cladophialophora chaetospira]|uniref:AP complex mu/sigma subunit domain-containing protein n=1 Tax=Cladophialophora chaetospira TaxID=386627 RepID=A0AA39CNA1_9EURO|nr:hypothetical protein H2200_002664 [Cladophialophora chaetospira]
MINAVLVFNNNGQPRLTKFYSQLDTATQQSLLSQIFALVSARPASACNFLPLPPLLAPSSNSASPDAPTQITYRHYATLYFILISTSTESPLALLDFIQVFVEALDRLFENVCELDLIFGFETLHAVLRLAKGQKEREKRLIPANPLPLVEALVLLVLVGLLAQGAAGDDEEATQFGQRRLRFISTVSSTSRALMKTTPSSILSDGWRKRATGSFTLLRPPTMPVILTLNITEDSDQSKSAYQATKEELREKQLLGESEKWASNFYAVRQPFAACAQSTANLLFLDCTTT